MTEVSPIREDDAEALVKLFSNAGPFVSARHQSDYWLYARLFSTTCLCLRDIDGVPVAAIIAFVDQTPGMNEIYIQDLAVRSDHRRQGHGESLMIAIRDVAERLDIRRLWLTSEAENSAAFNLWLNLGYENPEADYKDRIWMTRDFKGSGKDRAIFEFYPNPDSDSVVS